MLKNEWHCKTDNFSLGASQSECTVLRGRCWLNNNTIEYITKVSYFLKYKFDLFLKQAFFLHLQNCGSSLKLKTYQVVDHNPWHTVKKKLDKEVSWADFERSKDVMISWREEFGLFSRGPGGDLGLQGLPLAGAQVEVARLGVVVNQPECERCQSCQNKPKNEEDFEPKISMLVDDQSGLRSQFHQLLWRLPVKARPFVFKKKL